MKIALSQIKDSPRPVRKSWDESKLEELAQSIAEQGLIVPIKVRPLDLGEYEIVYGHRRAEACRLAGLSEIDCIVEGVADDDALVQALIENVQREDMEPMDKAYALEEIRIRKGWPKDEYTHFENAGIMVRGAAMRLLALLKEGPKIQKLVSLGNEEGKVSERHVTEVRGAHLPREEHEAVLQKAADEHLSRQQARRVADSVKAAPTPEAKAALIRRPFSENTHDPELVKMLHGGDPHFETERQRQEKQARWDWEDSADVAAIIRDLKGWEGMIEDFDLAVRAGKFSPEARQYVAQRARNVARALNAWANELEA